MCGCLLSCPASATLPLPPSLLSLTFIPTTRSRNPFDPFPLISIQRCRGSLLPSPPTSLCLAPSLWFIEALAPFPAIVGLLSSLVDEERERGTETEREGRDFPLPPPTSVGVSMSRCVGYGEGTVASANITVYPIRGILPDSVHVKIVHHIVLYDFSICPACSLVSSRRFHWEKS